VKNRIPLWVETQIGRRRILLSGVCINNPCMMKLMDHTYQCKSFQEFWVSGEVWVIRVHIPFRCVSKNTPNSTLTKYKWKLLIVRFGDSPLYLAIACTNTHLFWRFGTKCFAVHYFHTPFSHFTRYGDVISHFFACIAIEKYARYVLHRLLMQTPPPSRVVFCQNPRGVSRQWRVGVASIKNSPPPERGLLR